MRRIVASAGFVALDVVVTTAGGGAGYSKPKFLFVSGQSSTGLPFTVFVQAMQKSKRSSIGTSNRS